MCDMQKLPTREDESCDEDPDMNFTYTAAGTTGGHFLTTNGQLPVTKLQQNVTNNGTTLSQVVGMVGGVNMGDGMQYMRTLDGGATLQATPQIISLPITLPGAKPGDPQSTVQIQVLNPSLLQQQQQPKYQMQIPIQGFQQGGTMLTVAYSPDNNEAGGIQLLGNTLPEGLQVVTALPQEMQLIQPSQADDTDQVQPMHQVFITQNQQIIINGGEESKALNNNTTTNNNNPDIADVIIKEETDDNNDEENSQETDARTTYWQVGQNQQNLVNYLSTLPPQQAQALPPSLQQFLRLNTVAPKIEIEVDITKGSKDNIENAAAELSSKKKKKYRKKPPKPARPKPGQVVITTSPDGGPLYCCPECNMAYPEKEQLELHLAVHKIERRFICGICGAGLKRKEHLERHKLGHNPERPYVCGLCRKGFKRREHLNLHAVIHSGVKTEMCGICGKGFYRKDHLRKHTRSHERRLREEGGGGGAGVGGAGGGGADGADVVTVAENPPGDNNLNTILPEITIHVPTSANINVPVQINIPQHVVSSLAAAQQQQQRQQQQQQQQQQQRLQQQQQQQLQQQQQQQQQRQRQQAASEAQSQLDELFAEHS